VGVSIKSSLFWWPLRMPFNIFSAANTEYAFSFLLRIILVQTEKLMKIGVLLSGYPKCGHANKKRILRRGRPPLPAAPAGL